MPPLMQAGPSTYPPAARQTFAYLAACAFDRYCFTSSTRRFLARPSSLSLEATGE